MKPARQFGPLPHRRYSPAVRHCVHCGAVLRYSHPVWAKPIQVLTGPEHVTNLGWRCSNPACRLGRTVYRSARAEARQVKGSGYGLDGVVRIGYLRFAAHRTREEIWREFEEATPGQLSERHVQNLLDVSLALLRAREQAPASAERRPSRSTAASFWRWMGCRRSRGMRSSGACAKCSAGR